MDYCIGTLILVSIVKSIQCGLSDPVVSRYSLANGDEFQHLIIDSNTGILYAGATNAIYQFEDLDSLTLIQKFRTGPALDSPLCNHNGDCIQLSGSSKKTALINRTLTNDHNQILILHPSRNALIACGTLRQGLCNLHSLHNISQIVSDPDGSVPVAANSLNATTVAFLTDDRTMYIAATFTFDAYRDAFPALATRSLTSRPLFQLVDPGDVIGQSGLIMRHEYRSDFRVYYVGGFRYMEYAFWASVQRSSAVDPSSAYVSKLLRVCVDDSRYETYSELPLECLGPDNSQYNILRSFHIGRISHTDERYLMGVFAKSSDPWKIDAKQKSFHSAVCAFSMTDIKSAFAFSSQRCNNGIGKWNLPHFGYDQKCHNVTSQSKISHDESCQYLRIGAEMPVTSAALITYFGHLLTSIKADMVNDKTVLFVGTSDGKLKKIYLPTLKTGREYDQIQLTNPVAKVNSRITNTTSAGLTSVINPDMVFDVQKRHLYVITKTELLKVAVETCGLHETCDACLSNNDPYCGWCTLENRCSSKHACPSSDLKYRFLPTNPDLSITCPNAVLYPSNISLNASPETELALQFNFLPPPNDGDIYRCIFHNSPVSAVYVHPNTLKCHLPMINERPKSTDHHGHIETRLKIWSSISGTVFHELPIVFFECGAYKRCTACIASTWPCHWCVLDNRCLDQSQNCMGTDEDIGHHPMHATRHHKNPMQRSHSNHIDQCPHINSKNLAPILVPSGHVSSIQLPVVNLDKLPLASRFGHLDCVAVIDSIEIKARGWLSENGRIIACDNAEYSYKSSTKNITANFQIQTASGAIIDQIQIHLYKCQMHGPDCTRCKNADPKYQCDWCDNQCQYRKSCAASMTDTVTACPSPIIRSVNPLTGPIEGGTRVEIRGSDLGYTRDDIEGRISIGGRVLCDVIDYSTAERIICTTRSSSTEFRGQVEIRMSNQQYTVSKSQESFKFVSVQFDGYHPSIGPKSGGTEIMISGTNLLDATSIHVSIGHVPCKVDRKKSTSAQLICITSASKLDRLTLHSFTVKLDNANRTISGRFDYIPDPRIFDIHPLATFKSGGRQLIVRGKYLNSIQRPLMYFVDKLTGHSVSENSICQVLNSTLILCPSPALLPMRAARLERNRAVIRRDVISADNIDPDDFIGEDNYLEKRTEKEISDELDTIFDRYIIGFTMDAVESVKRLDKFLVTVTPDPYYALFPSGKKVISKDESLILEGVDLNSACSEKDIRVFVGIDQCKITLITSTKLVCTLPAIIDGQSHVVVRVGYLEFHLGRVIYDSDSASLHLAGSGSSGIWDPALIGAVAAVCVSFLAAFTVAMVFWWRKKFGRSEKEYERVRMQIDSLESSIKQECKQAFTELQTDPQIDPAFEISDQYIHYQNREIFVEKILRMNPAIDWRYQYEDNASLSDTVADFEQILRSQRFVSILIDILDTDQIGSDDRVRFAGLLTASLIRDMHYFTDLLFTLLRDAIVKNTTKFKSSNEASILDELLAHWISICMYDHVIESGQGGALFVLYNAMKAQIQKGPIDAITGKAKHSFSEDSLLREQIEFESVTLRIIPPSLDSRENGTILCRVLSCDTIIQAKSKIMDALYKNIPFSNRPSLDDVELEWRSDVSRAGVLLQDDTNCGIETVPCSDHWRQLNTIQHYCIPNQALIAVLLKARSNYPFTGSLSHTYMSINSSMHLLSASSVSSGSSPKASIPMTPRRYSNANTASIRTFDRPMPIASIKYWHLIKPDANGGQNSPISEMYLTRLLATKGSVQNRVDDLFECIFGSVDSCFPMAVKFLFTFMDDEINRLGISDPNHTAYVWKTDCFFLKFWSRLIRYPDLLLDIELTRVNQNAVSVISQILIDTCASNDDRLGKDSPTHKLLFARDLARYRHMLARFYADIERLPVVDECELRLRMNQVAKFYDHEMRSAMAVKELFNYVLKYREKILHSLSKEPVHWEMQALKQRFEDATDLINRQSNV